MNTNNNVTSLSNVVFFKLRRFSKHDDEISVTYYIQYCHGQSRDDDRDDRYNEYNRCRGYNGCNGCMIYHVCHTCHVYQICHTCHPCMTWLVYFI